VGVSELNRALLALYRLGADDRHMRALAVPSAYRIHRYLLDVANDSPDTWTGIDEASQLLSIAYSTAYRCLHSLGRLGLIESMKVPARQSSKRSGGKHRDVWRARL